MNFCFECYVSESLKERDHLGNLRIDRNNTEKDNTEIESEDVDWIHLRFVAFMSVVFQVKIFWVVTPCSVAVGYRRFGQL
jgi:hypothetical protein